MLQNPVTKEDNLKQMNAIYDSNPSILQDFHSALYQNRILAGKYKKLHCWQMKRDAINRCPLAREREREKKITNNDIDLCILYIYYIWLSI